MSLQDEYEFNRVVIRRKARQLKKRPEFRNQDHEDLEQQLWLRLQEKEDRFDSTKGTWQAFANTVVTSAAKNLIRKAKAGKRYCPNLVSMSNMVDTGESLTLGDVLDDESNHRRRTFRRTDLTELQVDVRDMMSRLSEDQAKIAAMIPSHGLSEVARLLGLSRCEVKREIAHIRERFETSGLQKYFEEIPPTRRQTV